MLGKLVYDRYDDFTIIEMEALYRIYENTLERKYNIFDIVPSILKTGNTSVNAICSFINKNVHTCLQESSKICMNLKIPIVLSNNDTSRPALTLTRKVYQLGKIDKHYQHGFSLPIVLRSLKRGQIQFTSELFSGLLHNIQYDSFDDHVRTAERDLVHYLAEIRDFTTASALAPSKLQQYQSISKLLKEFLTTTHFPRLIKRKALILAEHVIREISAINQNIELLGTVYENGTINLKYLLQLVLPNDTIDNDIQQARDYLIDNLEKQKIVEKYLRIEKYQQAGPDQLLMEILGQLRDIGFATVLVTALHEHARFWQTSHMIANLNELLKLFDAYENLRGLPDYVDFITTIDKIKDQLQDSKNSSIEISCSNPRKCLRNGLKIIRKCHVIPNATKALINEFLAKSNCPCAYNDRKLPTTTTKTPVCQLAPVINTKSTTTRPAVGDRRNNITCPAECYTVPPKKANIFDRPASPLFKIPKIPIDIGLPKLIVPIIKRPLRPINSLRPNLTSDTVQTINPATVQPSDPKTATTIETLPAHRVTKPDIFINTKPKTTVPPVILNDQTRARPDIPIDSSFKLMPQFSSTTSSYPITINDDIPVASKPELSAVIEKTVPTTVPSQQETQRPGINLPTRHSKDPTATTLGPLKPIGPLVTLKPGESTQTTTSNRKPHSKDSCEEDSDCEEDELKATGYHKTTKKPPATHGITATPSLIHGMTTKSQTVAPVRPNNETSTEEQSCDDCDESANSSNKPTSVTIPTITTTPHTRMIPTTTSNEIVDSLKKENKPTTMKLPETRFSMENATTSRPISTSPAAMSTTITPPTTTKVLCHHRDPNYRRRLTKLKKIRRLSAEKPPKTTIADLFESSLGNTRNKSKIPIVTNNTEVNNRSKKLLNIDKQGNKIIKQKSANTPIDTENNQQTNATGLESRMFDLNMPLFNVLLNDRVSKVRPKKEISAENSQHDDEVPKQKKKSLPAALKAKLAQKFSTKTPKINSTTIKT